jgi:hypothetical protein
LDGAGAVYLHGIEQLRNASGTRIKTGEKGDVLLIWEVGDKNPRSVAVMQESGDYDGEFLEVLLTKMLGMEQNVSLEAGWLSYEHEKFPTTHVIQGFKLYYPDSWELSVSEIPEAPKLELTLTKQNATIRIEQFEGGAGFCRYPEDPVVDSMAGYYTGYREIVTNDGRQLRIAKPQNKADGNDYIVCEYLAEPDAYSQITQVGRITVTLPPDADALVGEVDEILQRIEIDDLGKFAHEDLPGFSFEYPVDWVIEINPFHIDTPEYFGDIELYPTYARDSGCGIRCMSVKLSKNNIDIYLIAHLSYDFGGKYCSNTKSFESLDDGWYRIENPNGYYYSTNLVKDKTISEEEAFLGAFVDGEVQRLAGGETFIFCDYYPGSWLVAEPSVAEWGTGLADARLWLEKPKVIGSPDEVLLAEIDEIMMSIQGIEGRPDSL